ncbi:MAG: hypothetical protein ACRDI0_03430 [Actinomycetota bacterium]
MSLAALIGRTHRWLAVVLAAAVACTAGVDGRPGPGGSPTPTASPLPEMARFEAGLNLIRATGVSCRGVAGPWRVRLHPPQPIDGKGMARFRLKEAGTGRLRWSFTAAHPIQGTVTYAGDLRVRLVGTDDRPALTFAGTQTNVGATARTFARAAVEVGGACKG